MDYKLTALISTISNSFCDFTLDIAVNKFHKYKVLLYTALISLFFQILFSFFVGINFTVSSIPIIIFYGVCMLLGYISFVKALQYIPIGLVALLETGQLFFVLFIDIVLGYIKLNPLFIFMFILFVISIIWFTFETYKVKDNIRFKTIRLVGIVFSLLTILFYGVEPYLIKLASSMGANEIAINFGYSLVALPFFFIMLRNNKDQVTISKGKNKNNFILLIVLIGLFESIYYFLGTISYIGETAIIVTLVAELRVFLLVILSVLFKTDKMNWKKAVALLLGMIAITVICFS